MKKLSILPLVLLLLLSAVPAQFYGNAAAAYAEVWVDDDAPPSWYGGNHVATIQEALSIIEPGGTIHVLPGNYHNNSLILIQMPVRIVGQEYPTVRDPIQISDTGDVEVSGLKIQPVTAILPSVPGWASGYREYTAVFLKNASRVTLSNNIIGPTARGAGVYAFLSTDLTVVNNTFTKLPGSAINLQIVINGTIENNVFTANALNGYATVFMYFVAKNVNVRGNVFLNNYKTDVYSFWALDSGSVSNNRMTSSPSLKTTAVYLSWSPDNEIRGNVITGYENGVKLEYASGTLVSGNAVSNCSGWGMYLGPSGNDVIEDNRVENCNGGMYLYRMDFFRLANNVILNSSTAAVRIEGTRNLTTFEIPRVSYEWIDTSSLTPDMTITGYNAGRTYQLPFTFPFFGRNITKMYVTTNGVIELLNSSQTPLTAWYDNHLNKFYMGRLDAIFALSEYYLAFGGGYINIYNLSDKVVVDYYVGTYPDWYRYYLLTGSAYYRVTDRYLRLQVVIYEDGRIRWNLKEIMPFAHYADLWLGVYSKNANTEGFSRDVLYRMALTGRTSYGFSGEPTETFPNSVVENNLVEDGAGDGIFILDSGSLILTGNTVNNFTRAGISVTNSTNIEILNGIITNSGTGVSSFNSSGIEVHHNTIIGNGIGVSNHPLGNETPWVNATKNWWGSSDGPSRIDGMEYSWRTPTGSGDYVTNYVYFDPWSSPELQYALDCILSQSLAPCQATTVRVRVTNPSSVAGQFTLVLKDGFRVIDVKRIHLDAHETKIVTFTFQFATSGLHQLSVNGDLRFNVTVGGGSTIDVGNGAQLLSIMWTLMFYSQYDEFEALYERALSKGVDNETLQLALEKYNNATETMLTAWDFDDIDVLRTAFWVKKVARAIYLARDAYLGMKEAVGILAAALS